VWDQDATELQLRVRAADGGLYDGGASGNASVSAPGTYRVGVLYFCDHGRGASRATVRIYCDGAQAAEFGPKLLAASGDFWDAATVVWPGCTVTEVNATRSVAEHCASSGP